MTSVPEAGRVVHRVRFLRASSTGAGDDLDVSGALAQAGVVDLPEAVRRVAVEQRGVMRRSQLVELGVTVDQFRWSVGRSWRLLLPGVVLLGPGLPNEDQRQIAALLYAGPRSWLSGPTAAQLHGLAEPSSGDRVHVLVPAPLSPRTIAWVSIRRTHVTDERVIERAPLRFSCRPRALVDTAAVVAPDAARALMIDAVRRRVVRLDDVGHWIEVRRPNGRRVLRAVLAEAAAGTWSIPEADLAALVRSSRLLPEAMANPELNDPEGRRLTTPDLWLDDVGMAVMVHSRQFHAGLLDWQTTVTDDGDLSSCRIAVIGVTPEGLSRDPQAELRRIERAYRTARASGFRPDVRATPRSGSRAIV